MVNVFKISLNEIVRKTNTKQFNCMLILSRRNREGNDDNVFPSSLVSYKLHDDNWCIVNYLKTVSEETMRRD